KHREKSDDEEKPQASAIAVSDGGRGCARIRNAFSRRSRRTKSAGVEPMSAWNTRWKWNGESSATRARSRSRSGSSRWPTMWSMERLPRWTYVTAVADRVRSEIRKIWQALPGLAVTMDRVRSQKSEVRSQRSEYAIPTSDL